jgi:hypothetical protein
MQLAMSEEAESKVYYLVVVPGRVFEDGRSAVQWVYEVNTVSTHLGNEE